ncbi:hypothetical protein NLI96_g3470 [Meripilus lineatus]|uniref:Major facilitator superfamily (MFS) profile domain-containing protein n=1 Tax=Meripilus lineatus TaxID=2056292 RepID=A0AAD5V6C6_9APHY|nr:hypothetical protein NLI96_g3470 [Physisporinus lineatus]
MTGTQDADEQSPLLGQPPRAKQTPLPKLQLAAIYAIKLLVPIAGTQILPYLNLMIQELLEKSGTESNKDRVGYYSGLVSTATHVSQLLPVILLGTIGIAVSTTLFGLSQSFTAVLLTRFLAGLFGGMIGAIHSVVGELSDSTNQSTAFPLYDIVSALGFVIGPLIGGTFANPLSQHPSWPWKYLPNHQLFVAYPYLLPCLVTSFFALIAATLVLYVLEETLPSRRKPSDKSSSEPRVPTPSSSSSSSDIESPNTTNPLQPLPLRALLTIPAIRAVSLSSFALGFIAAAFNVVFVLVAYTDTKSGGLGFDPAQIGQALSIMGFISIFLKLSMTVILRPDRPHALTWLFNLTMSSWVLTFLAFPFLSWVVALSENSSQGLLDEDTTLTIMGRKAVWFAASFVLLLSRIGCMAFTLVLILSREVSPNVASLGTTNGFTEFAQVLGIMGSPVIVSSLFAYSITHHALGGYLWVLVFSVAAAGCAFIASQVGKYRSSGFSHSQTT